MAKKTPVNKVLLGDAADVLAQIPDSVFDLVVTSPPYADSRKATYGGPHPNDFVNWFMPVATEIQRVLKPSGTLILNIKERVVAGERHTYVIDLIIEMKNSGWRWTEEFIWHKKNSFPGRWPNRFRDAWERCLQFNKQSDFQMFQEAVMVPIGEWSTKRLKNLSQNDRYRMDSQVRSGFGKNVSRWIGRKKVFPTNVIHLATECSNRSHSAAFPVALPEWFIRLFTKTGDLVLDPFCGSGTTLIAARNLGRNFVGVEIDKGYYKIARKAVSVSTETRRERKWNK